ncbi:MAG: hypothetical protein ACD_73C00820G0005 [uncultured bacterium]|nr:MAG: hypothetical protein ACD_73C00820G0005 [uncultured bacterium]
MKKNFELSRKSIHALSLLVPWIYLYNKTLCFSLLAGFSVFYLILEVLKLNNKSIFLNHWIAFLHRDEEKSKWAPAPLYLALGVMGCLYFFPWNVSFIAIYCAGICDIMAALCGKKWGVTHIPFSERKTIVGTGAFFLTALPVCFYFLPPSKAITTAMLGAFLESLPLKDWDNLTVPLIVGFVANQFLY